MPIAAVLLPEFDQEIKSTRKLLECVPDGKFDYKPHEKSMSLGQLAGHVAQIPEYTVSTIKLERLDFTGQEKPFAPTTRIVRNPTSAITRSAFSARLPRRCWAKSAMSVPR